MFVIDHQPAGRRSRGTPKFCLSGMVCRVAGAGHCIIWFRDM